MPIIMKKRLVTNNTYFLSFHAAPMKMVVLRGWTRGVMMKHANSMNGSMRKAMMRMDHPKPKSEAFSNFERTMGKSTPPMLDPETARPMAYDGEGGELEEGHAGAHEQGLCEYELVVL
jgi:hypothetical protein